MEPEERQAAKILINPYSTITFKDELFQAHDIDGAIEDWVKKNTELVHEIGTKDWLDEFLNALSPGTPPDYVRDSVINPFRGVHFSERLRGSHEPIIERAVWIEANAKMIDELGAETWLWRLLEVLETGGSNA